MPKSYLAASEIDSESIEIPVDTIWWQRFSDPILDGLVSEAAVANHDIRQALARVEIARAGLNIADADFLPNFDAFGVAKDNTTSYPSPIRQQLPNVQAGQAGLQASWEIDLFGRARAARRAANADLIGAKDAHRGALLLAISETAEKYFILRGAQTQRRIIIDLIQTERETLRLTELRRARGLASDFDLDRARGALADTEAMTPRLDTQITTTRNHIAVLIGRQPGTWLDPVTGAPEQIAVPTIPISQPMDLLRRRPDIMAADANLAAAGFRGDAARANQFPQLMISALFGQQWTSINALDIGGARFANLGGALTLPIFEGGRIQAGISAANAAQRQAVAQYEQTVLRALEDVEGAMTSYRNNDRRGQALDQSINFRKAAAHKARSLYEHGEIDLLQVLDVEQSLLNARLEGAVNQTARLTDVVQTYKALGGGWEPFEGDKRIARQGDAKCEFPTNICIP